MALPFPVIYLLSTHLGAEELRTLEAQIPTITHNVHEAEVLLGNISRKERALFELRRLGVKTGEPVHADSVMGPPPEKRRRISALDSTGETPSPGIISTADDDEVQFLGSRPSQAAGLGPARFTASAASRTESSIPRKIRVVKLAWFIDSSTRREVLPLVDYLLYEGLNLGTIEKATSGPPASKPSAALARHLVAGAAQPSEKPLYRREFFARPSQKAAHDGIRSSHGKRPVLLHQSTSEHDAAEHMPPIPDFLHTTYSCQRPTPIDPPNDAFIEELKKIRTTRLLIGDRIGVRAYSSAIASLAAYPYLIASPEEVERLPGCGPKIALLFQEYKHNGGVIAEAQEMETDSKLAVLKHFYDVWGVGDTTAKEWYDKGWRDLDDAVEYGWETLTRVQQIGVKFYDELLLKIPRSEVKSIADIVLEHANGIRSGFEMVIVGGYRRGKTESGDVDLVLSHPVEDATLDFVTGLVISLESSGHITHTLTLSTKNSERGQVPVSWKGEDRKGPRAGFDTLDKALVVWQDPNWTPSPGVRRNPNPHRRVDIIVSPWKTAGCAVLSWTSGTTFQRDMRRYCKRELGLKFDSSGIRSRDDGRWVDVESDADGRPAPDMLTAEKRVFEAIRLEWRSPEERSTG